MTPITPEKARETKVSMIPPEILEAVNELIVQNITQAGAARVLQKDIITLARQKMAKTGSPHINADFFKYGWLDIEPVYEVVGWKVKYDKPSFDEHFDAYFLFTDNGAKK